MIISLIDSLIISVKLSIISTLILLIIGILISLWLVFCESRFKMVVEVILILPLILPPSIVGFYLLILFNPNGILGKIWQYVFHTNLIFTFTSLVIGSVIYSVPFAVQPIRSSFQLIEKKALETAFTLGLGHFKTFIIVILPMSIYGILSAIVLSFMHTIGEFGIILMLGGGINPSTEVISIKIFNYVEELNYYAANEASIILLLFSVFMSAILLLLRKHVRG